MDFGVLAVAQLGSHPTGPWEDGVLKFKLCQIFCTGKNTARGQPTLSHTLRQIFAWALQSLLFAERGPSAHLLPPPLQTLLTHISLTLWVAFCLSLSLPLSLSISLCLYYSFCLSVFLCFHSPYSLHLSPSLSIPLASAAPDLPNSAAESNVALEGLGWAMGQLEGTNILDAQVDRP